MICLGQSTVAKTLSNSNGSRATIYAYPVQPTSQAGVEQTLELPTVVVTSSTTQPPVAILQTALSGNLYTVSQQVSPVAN